MINTFFPPVCGTRYASCIEPFADALHGLLMKSFSPFLKQQTHLSELTCLASSPNMLVRPMCICWTGAFCSMNFDHNSPPSMYIHNTCHFAPQLSSG